MANCDICYQEDAPIAKVLHSYTAIQEQTKIKTGYKTYEIRSRTIAPKQHTYEVCKKCVNKIRTIGIIVWAVAIVLSIFIFVVAVNLTTAANDGGPLGLAILAVPILVVAYFLSKNTLSLRSKIDKLAIRDRRKTYNGTPSEFLYDPDRRFAAGDKQIYFVALTHSGFQELTKKIAATDKLL